MITSANIVAYDGYNLIVRPRDRIGRELSQKQVNEVEIRIVTVEKYLPNNEEKYTQ